MIYFHSVSIVLEHLWQSELIIIHKSLLYTESPLHRKHYDQYFITFSLASETASADAPSKIRNNDHVVYIMLVMVL